MEEPAKLNIEIKNNGPIELVDLTKSLLALADEYKRHLVRSEDSIFVNDIRLYVNEIRTGSIIASLIAMAPMALPLLENANTVADFTLYLKSAFNFLLGKETNKPALEKANYENLAQILEPVAKDNGSQFNINTFNNSGPIVIKLDSLNANAIQNSIAREIAALQTPMTGNHEKVLLYWYQARNDIRNQNGDKAIVESIYSGPVKTIFANEDIKSKILSSSENLFTRAYIVDVSVETIQNKPAVYKIIEMHESIERN